MEFFLSHFLSVTDVPLALPDLIPATDGSIPVLSYLGQLISLLFLCPQPSSQVTWVEPSLAQNSEFLPQLSPDLASASSSDICTMALPSFLFCFLKSYLPFADAIHPSTVLHSYVTAHKPHDGAFV
jgi:hypothetical protein